AGTPEALASMTCGGARACTLELFDRARAVAPFTRRTVALTDLPQADLASDNVTGVQPELMNRGHAYDLAVDGARVFVSTPAEASGFVRCEQRLDHPSRLRVFDAETLAEVASATVGPCLGALGADPFGPGALGAFIDRDGEWTLARFDAEAVRVDARTIRALSPVHTSPGYTVDRLLVLDTRAEIAVLFRPAESAPESSIVTIHDARTLEEKWRTALGAQRLGAGLRADGDVLLTLIPVLRLVQSIDLEGRQLANRELFGFDEGRENVAHDVLPLEPPGAERLLVGQGTRKLVHLAQDGLQTTIAPLSSDADLTRVERWPADPSLMLVAGSLRRDGRPLREAEVALYDAVHRRFLPGAWPVGGGIVSRIAVDGANRVFLLLPWSGALVRLEPTP
ncbi:hypothetical protein L6R52_19350, partial [Myxococcota bacterium]|nr:hypothetical protein [Myxococcota bacterium]